MNPDRRMNYLELAKAVLGSPPATKATDATKGVLEAVWKAGGLLVISDRGVRAVRVPKALSVWMTQHEEEVLQALHQPISTPIHLIPSSRGHRREESAKPDLHTSPF